MNKNTALTLEEQNSLNYAKRLKEFYESFFTYIVLAVVFFSVFGGEAILFYIFGGLAVWMIIHGLIAFEVISFMSPTWEKRIAERKLGRKL